MNEIAKAILAKNEHAVLATVTPNGAPRAVPVHIAFDAKNVYWVSSAEAVHSLNIAHDGRVAIVAFDSHQDGSEPGEKGAVYIATTARELSGDEEILGRKVYYDRYPNRNIEKFQEWSIYSAPIGEIDEAKSHDAMVYFVSEGGVA